MMKILCLHGFRTSGNFLRKQISKWDSSIFANFDMEYPNGIYPAGGKSEIEGFFPAPYFEWFQFNEEFTEYTNLEECISYLCDYITSNGPFDGLLGFSQGATLAALLLGYKAQGEILKDHPEFKLLISISGSKFRDPTISKVAYKEPIKVKSVHFIGEKDWLKLPSEELAGAFEKPLVIRHPQGHTVPRLSEQDASKLGECMDEFCTILSNSNGMKNDDNESLEVQEKSIGIEKKEAESLKMESKETFGNEDEGSSTLSLVSTKNINV